MLLIIFTLLATSLCQELEIKALDERPILVTKHKNCKIQAGNIKIIHTINLTDLEATINLLTNTAYTNIDDKNQLTHIVKYKVKQLYSNFYQLKPSNHRRQKRWDRIGTTWKWIAGNPDAEDLRIINTTLHQLIEENNNQYHVNEQIGLRIQQLTSSITQTLTNNKVIMNEIDILTMIVNIDTVNTILTNIHDAILLSKALVTSSKILSPKEIHMIKQLIEQQGVPVEMPDEAFNLVTPKFTVSDEMLLYILQLPQLEKGESKVIRILPLTINDAIINSHPEFLVKTGRELFTTTSPDEYVQRSSFIKKFNDACIAPLVLGKNSHCNTSADTETRTKLLTDNLVLITNAKNQHLDSDCGPDNRTIQGNLLISFSNCSIIFNKRKISSSEVLTQSNVLEGALHNLVMESIQIKDHNIESVHNNTIVNRHHLQQVNLAQYNNKMWNWGLLGGLSASTITLTAFIVFVIFKSNCILRGVARKIANQRNQRTTLKPRVEDDTSLPPGGVASIPIGTTPDQHAPSAGNGAT